MPRIDPGLWQPVGVDELEEGAWGALRCRAHTLVVAGPGAGKTEFLAQKAAFILQTRPPSTRKRVLAISFKKDAAKNLGERFESRYGKDLRSFFISVTFDAFVKGLVDRFRLGLPEAWRPTADYEFDFKRVGQIRSFLRTARQRCPVELRNEQFWTLDPVLFVPMVIGTYRLQSDVAQVATAEDFAVEEWWRQALRGTDKSALDFVALNRLAELLCRVRVELRRALVASYSHVFVDEFQDTTYAQYDLLKSLFSSVNGPIVTVVGDPRQRIMGFAGAVPRIFGLFREDFPSQSFPLLLNRRSLPPLVRLQKIVAARFGQLPDDMPEDGVSDGEPAVIEAWRFGNWQCECRQIARWIASAVRARGSKPSDYAVLVRKNSHLWATDLAPALRAFDIRLRDDSAKYGPFALQDMLADPLFQIVAAVLRLANESHGPDHWIAAVSGFERLREADSGNHKASKRAIAELRHSVARVRAGLLAKPYLPRVSGELIRFPG